MLIFLAWIKLSFFKELPSTTDGFLSLSTSSRPTGDLSYPGLPILSVSDFSEDYSDIESDALSRSSRIFTFILYSF